MISECIAFSLLIPTSYFLLYYYPCFILYTYSLSLIFYFKRVKYKSVSGGSGL